MSKSAKTDGTKLGGSLIDEIAEFCSEIMADPNRNKSQRNAGFSLPATPVKPHFTRHNRYP